MLVSLIAALTDDHVIGIDNRLPWKLPADMRWFRRHTLGKTVIMGRKTFESLGCRPLPERRNVVVTSDRGFTAEGADVVHDIDAALAAPGPGEEELMVIGGASFYEQMLPRARRLYLTYVHADIEGDAWFPRFDALQWQEVQREDHAADEKNPYPYSFVILERR
ncbi:MAG TPA: type 3 dihydrofolate reductase [Gammaproteobacteria bacterium]|nr:type 3 dihydrofolate reductase [Gammaproteobacteria bacterium]